MLYTKGGIGIKYNNKNDSLSHKEKVEKWIT